ncbi:hypothetical protein MNBD_ALPHA09-1880 [hydrothermal vent metagenome]|uniref:EamA domain-containing protein n=1 Tax=hydrothermal vent metagenome TaxID=652676 RepID=A0A3B0T975_9ZZZZ
MSATAGQTNSRSLADWASLAALVVAWGSAFAITKVALETITPIWTVSLRVLVAVLIFLPIFYATGQSLPRNREFWLWMVVVSLIGTLLPFFFIAWGTQYVDTGVVGVLIGAVPIFTMAMAHFTVPGERASPAKILGFAIGFTGLVVLVSQGSTVDFSGGRLVFYGQIAIIAAAFCYAFQGICAKIMPPATAWQKALAGSLIALVPAFAFSFASGTEGVSGASWTSLIAVVALGTLSTAIAGLIMFRLIASAGPSFTSLTSYLIPVYTLVLGAMIFSEKAGSYTLIGMVLILGGIAISEFWSRRT